MRYLQIAINAFFVFGLASGYSQENLSNATKESLQKHYAQISTLFAENNSTFAASTNSSPEKLEYEFAPASSSPERYIVSGPLNVQFDARSLKLISAFDYQLYKTYSGSSIKNASPKLTIDSALERARSYLTKFNFIPSKDMQLKSLDYGKNYPLCWEARWTLCANGIFLDDFVPSSTESLFVIFNEQDGLIAVGNNVFSPFPARADILLTREQAISKASKYLALVQRTSFYLQGRKDGFVANGVKSCELKITTPNWLLDPARAVWIRDTPPTETRICWVVRFTTVDSKEGERGLTNKDGKPLKLVPPDILIYLDAETGDVVGANFT